MNMEIPKGRNTELQGIATQIKNVIILEDLMYRMKKKKNLLLS